MRIVCQRTILMKYHALFVIFEKKNSEFFCNCRLMQIIGGALRVNEVLPLFIISLMKTQFIFPLQLAGTSIKFLYKTAI